MDRPRGTYLALFRGINVGGNNIISMQELVEVMSSLGCEEVQTYIQSGNVVFRSRENVGAESAMEIGNAVRNRKGFEPRVMILGQEQFREAIKNNPFPTHDGKALQFFFLESVPDPDPDLERLEALRFGTEKYEIRRNILYLYAPDGIGRSKLAAGIEKAVGVAVTARNWNTVEKIASMLDADQQPGG